MTVDLSVNEEEVELLLILVDRVLRPRRRPQWSPHHKRTAALLAAKLANANNAMLAALMRASEPGGG